MATLVKFSYHLFGRSELTIQRPDSGFTLIELLTALAVGSLLLVLLGGVLGQLRQGWTVSREIATRVTGEAAGMARLQALVAAGLPADPQSKEIAFEGDADSFRLRTLPPQAFAAMGTVWAEVTLRKDRGSLTLVQVALNNDRDEINAQTLMTSQNDVHFSYDTRDDKGGISVANRIAGSSRLPLAIHLQLRAPRSQKVVRSIALVPQNTIDGRCLFDPVSFACRL
jgi:prepilin-type N-terminal cleavage/methylation domain-containing protein